MGLGPNGGEVRPAGSCVGPAAGRGQEGAGGGRSCSGEAEEARRWQQVEAGARRGGAMQRRKQAGRARCRRRQQRNLVRRRRQGLPAAVDLAKQGRRRVATRGERQGFGHAAHGRSLHPWRWRRKPTGGVLAAGSAETGRNGARGGAWVQIRQGEEGMGARRRGAVGEDQRRGARGRCRPGAGGEDGRRKLLGGSLLHEQR